MVSSNVVSACVLFISNSLIYSYVTADDLDKNSEWKGAIGEIKELERQVKRQDDRILTLEKRTSDAKVLDMKRTIEFQNDRINHLEARIYEFQNDRINHLEARIYKLEAVEVYT